MLKVLEYMTIQNLWKKGKNKSEISRITGHDWKTVAKVIKNLEKGEEMPKKKLHPRLLDPYKEQIIEWIEEGLTIVRIHEKLKNVGIKIGYTTVRDYVSSIKRKTKIFIRKHTAPAEEAEVDFGYIGYTKDNKGKKRKTYVFNMKLSFSRMDYYEKVYDQKVETFINCHINAFTYFGGIPKYVKIDNLKAAILEANFYEPIFQGLYKKFSEHYKFDPISCRPYKPNDKGKVESGIKYVKNNFFLGRTFKDGNDLDRQLKYWLNNTCNKRVHGTTKKVPKELFLKEKALLTKLPDTEFFFGQIGKRKVYHDCHIYVNYNYYSVPFEYVGKEVEISLNKGILKIYYNYKEIATHIEKKDKGEFSTFDHHYPKYKKMSDTEYQERYQVKMKNIGPYAEQLFFLILENQKNFWYKSVQGILSLEKKYSKKIIDLSCKRAIAYGAYKYQIIKNICKNGAYRLPMELLCKQ
jgi:transposase